MKNISFREFYKLADEMFYNWGVILTSDDVAFMFRSWDAAGRPDLESYLYNNFT